jgi:flagellar biogenesis protein FliO
MSATEMVMNLYTRSRAGIVARRTEKQMHLLETLPLGGKRQLMLIRCGEQRFLVGAGVDGVQTIVEVGK